MSDCLNACMSACQPVRTHVWKGGIRGGILVWMAGAHGFARPRAWVAPILRLLVAYWFSFWEGVHAGAKSPRVGIAPHRPCIR